MKHIAILSNSAIKQVFSGKKTIETRFSQKRISPFGTVSIGDIVYLKPPGEDIVGQFVVKKVIYIEGLEASDWDNIKKVYGKKLSLGSLEEDDKFFKIHQNAKYATIIFISNVEQFITSPIKFTKKDLRGWVILK
ncbi:MAG: hypothetical protein ACD_30C00041G0012 [uncultured bacterium]|uniref:ASCH domain-containing protein n=2 Tax=Candidatus Daviesiibacteriota TaxID=1752718 RepID=A0A0G0EU23_9BACT|nr:MAG: hypothetical protein ACD_30C00041G0012 [uncultured bacterium]KKQ09072.1 MAG: hypothetical protein US19_C0017G0017 [Candidatus Daviesbacteria bacterium GW2011_GWB1_36_5]KKQ16108.1 MAG: hypothetical protein US28_C0005G0023 [Candidatus Daviesbacteria bacterium GW2011_GWA1_36_8]